MRMLCCLDIHVQITKLVSLGHENWLPLAERLTGWTKEVRVRTSGIHDTVIFSTSVTWSLHFCDYYCYCHRLDIIVIIYYLWCSICKQFYYHGDKKYRTFRDVKRYIYLGYPPCSENGDDPLVRVLTSIDVIIICQIFLLIWCKIYA